MKSGIKFFLACATLGLWMAACGPVTAVPTIAPSAITTLTPKPKDMIIPTATVKPSTTPIPSATPTSSLPTLFALEGPEKDLLAYRLRTWTEADSVQVVNELGNLAQKSDEQIPYNTLPNYTVAFELERLLKFPGSPAKMDALWDILLSQPATAAVPGHVFQQDLMAFYLQDVLANGTSLTELVDTLEGDEKHPFIVTDNLSIKNITAKGIDGIILVVKFTPLINYDGLTAVYVIFPENNSFHIERIRDWQSSQAPAFGRDFQITDVGDTNGNERSEFVIDITAGSSGDPQTWREDIEHYEWSEADKKFVGNTFPVFFQDCEGSTWGEGPCEGKWEFSQKNTQRMLTTKSFWFTHKDCPDLTIQTDAIWNGEQYRTGKPYNLPPDAGLSAECRLSWADTAIRTREQGWKNDLAISILESSLENWPVQANKWWGPASRDYFKLRLGVWHELRGNDDITVKTLSQLADKPADAQYDFAASMSKLFLKRRQQINVTRACLDLQNAFWDGYQAISSDSQFGFRDTLPTWGFTKDGSRYFPGKICDVYEILPLDVKSAHVTSPASLSNWINKTNLTIYQNESIDLNRDGLEDRLILMDTTGSNSPDVWAFLATADGYIAIFVHDLWTENAALRAKISPIQAGDNNFAYLVVLDKDFAFFRITKDFKAEILAKGTGVRSFETTEIAPVQVKINIDNYPDGKKTLNYVWDSLSSNFVEQDEFKNAQIKIEKLLYSEQDYNGTIDYINQFLQAEHQEPFQPYQCGTSIPGGCNYEPAWYSPYFRYLLGVTYEQLGQQQQAIQTYYELWRDYPKNVFGMVASLKLEPIAP
jgi:hypothetical protein